MTRSVMRKWLSSLSLKGLWPFKYSGGITPHITKRYSPCAAILNSVFIFQAAVFTHAT